VFIVFGDAETFDPHFMWDAAIDATGRNPRPPGALRRGIDLRALRGRFKLSRSPRILQRFVKNGNPADQGAFLLVGVEDGVDTIWIGGKRREASALDLQWLANGAVAGAPNRRSSVRSISHKPGWRDTSAP
jgi:hypothetical protein